MTPPLPPSFYHSLETFVWVLFESLFNLSHQNNLDVNNECKKSLWRPVSLWKNKLLQATFWVPCFHM